MIALQLLEDNDIIKATDYCRQLSLIYTGQSDYLATNNTYSGARMNRLGWMTAKEVCPSWVGKTVREFNIIMDNKDRHETEVTQYEFIRGNIPKSHLE